MLGGFRKYTPIHVFTYAFVHLYMLTTHVGTWYTDVQQLSIIKKADESKRKKTILHLT